MAIGPVTLNGTVSRVQDMSIIKHNEDAKGMTDQSNFQMQLKKEVDGHLNRVRHADDSEMEKKKQDAKEKGSNEYAGDGGRKRKQEKKDGKVIVRGHSSFDVKI